MKRKLEEFKLIEEFVMIDTNEIKSASSEATFGKSASSEATFGNFNPVENLLIYKCLSIKTLKKILNCSKNTIKQSATVIINLEKEAINCWRFLVLN